MRTSDEPVELDLNWSHSAPLSEGNESATLGRSSSETTRDDAPIAVMTESTRPRPVDVRGGPPLLTVQDVALQLGVTVRHVRRLVSERRIPYIKWGHLV